MSRLHHSGDLSPHSKPQHSSGKWGQGIGQGTGTFAPGVGELIVTCFSQHSRNHRVGLALDQGKTLEEAVAALGMVAEGLPNTKSIYGLAHRIGARTPIIDAVYDILYNGKPALQTMHELLGRDPRPATRAPKPKA